jgi:DNA polymerase III alpha subunit
MFASFRLEDMDGSIDAVIFSDRLENAREFLSEGGFVVLEGTVSVKGESSKVFVNRVIDLKSAMATLVEGLRITQDMNGFKESGIDDLRRMISTNAGHIPVFIRAYDGTEPIVTLRIRKGSVRHEPGFLDDLRKIPGIKRAEWKVRPVSIGERVNGRNHYGKGKNSTLQT